jgi:hypothetical protein
MIILQEGMPLPGSFNLISQSYIMDKNVKVEPVNHYGLNLYHRHDKSIATGPQVDGRFVLDRSPAPTESTDIDDSFLLALKTTAHASRHNAKKRMLWHRRLAQACRKALDILSRITNAPKMTAKCNCESCIKCKLARKHFTPTTSRATDRLQLVHSDRCGPPQTAIGGGRYMLLFIDHPTRNTDEYILMYKSEALEKFKE